MVALLAVAKSPLERRGRDLLAAYRRVAKEGRYHAACFVTRPCLCPSTLGTLEALAHASVDLLAEDVALLARQATNEASRSHGINGDSVGTSTALN